MSVVVQCRILSLVLFPIASVAAAITTPSLKEHSMPEALSSFWEGTRPKISSIMEIIVLNSVVFVSFLSVLIWLALIISENIISGEDAFRGSCSHESLTCRLFVWAAALLK